MNAKGKERKGLKRLLSTHFTIVLAACAVVLFALSFITPGYSVQMNRQVRRVERSLHHRQHLMEKYALKAIESDNSTCIEFDDMPDDMVLYKYRNDTLQCWTHEFPISNDEVDAYPFSYRLFYQSNSMLSSPLAYVGVEEQYVNLGSAWYIINTQLSTDHRTKVLTGIMVKTEYTSDNLRGRVNPKLHLGKGFTTIGVTESDAAIVYGVEGAPLFSVIPLSPAAFRSGNITLRWMALILAVLALFAYHLNRRSWISFGITVGGLLAARVAGLLLARSASSTMGLFSPIIYADNRLFDSLGSLLMNDLLVALCVYALFAMRYVIFRRLEKTGDSHRAVASVSMLVLAVALLFYIHFTLRSLTLNSNIVLEPFRISDVSFYSALCFVSFAMLFLALLFLLQMFVVFKKGHRKVSLFSWRGLIIFSVCVALYFVVAQSVYVLRKEYETNRIRTAKIAVERDLPLELHLRSVEQKIATDQFVGILTSVKGIELIKNRLAERYFTEAITHNYKIKLTVCSPENYLELGAGGPPVGCFAFYQDEIDNYGVALGSNPYFYYINNFDGTASYLGVFTYVDASDYQVSRLYIELDSKYSKDPLDIWSTQSRGNALPRFYSYARYANGRLVRNDGQYAYSANAPESWQMGYSMVNENGYYHFVNRISDDEMTVVSRPHRNFFPYLVSFSYLAIFFGLFFIVCTRWGRGRRFTTLPKHSLRRKITVLTTGTMVLALASVGAAMIMYVVKAQAENNRSKMEEKISSVQSALMEHCRYAMRYNELNTAEFIQAVENVARVTQNDINIYDVHGRLIRSTKQELFDQFIIGKRMNNHAFHEIVHVGALRYFGTEKVASLSYRSLYAPLFNADGALVGVVNVPYLNSRSDITEATATTVSMLINLYLILLLMAVVLGRVLSNWMLRPLSELKNRMDSLAMTNSHNAHIRYRNPKDEIGVLVSSYNKMVDDLEASTRELARNERRQAWMDMASKIAHDIKNPLTPMRLSIQYLMMLKKQNVPGWEEKFDKMSVSLLEQIDILSDAASQFSSMASSEAPVEVDIDELISEVVTIFENNEDIDIAFVPSEEHTVLKCPRKKINRVLVNLITNSVQAIENSSGSGRVRISSSVVEAEPAVSGLDSKGNPAGTRYCAIAVEDDGPGVKQEYLDRIFTSSFTTKSSGSGVGLVNCKVIVEQSRGEITYGTSEMGGACFTVKLPVL